MQRVVSWFIRQGLYGRPQDVVLKVMDDRRLLAAARNAAPSKGKGRRTAPEPWEDSEQLKRALPTESLSLSFLVGIVLSGVVGACWLGVCILFFPHDLETWLWPYAAGAVFVACVYLIVVQHLYRALDIPRLVALFVEGGSRIWQDVKGLLGREPGKKLAGDVSVPGVAFWYQFVLAWLSLRLLLFAADHRVLWLASYPAEQSDAPFWVAVTAILTAKVLVPSLVSRWRASRLLYPTPLELARERILGLSQLAICAVLLALIAHWHIAGGAPK
jgi:hypothetical protein